MTKKKIWKNIQQVRAESPLIHNITNYVAMNFTANVLLAAGASPVMAHAEEEVVDMTAIAHALVVNIGTLSNQWITSMQLAMQKAKILNKPIVLDPVGVGATTYRNQMVQKLLDTAIPTIIRGNASEIMALVGHALHTKGVDSINKSMDAKKSGKKIVQNLNNIVCISGETDLVIDQHQIIALHNGHPMMQQVTAMGCAASALIGAFVAAQPTEPFLATASAMSLIGVAGQLTMQKAKGPGSLAIGFLDTLATITQHEFEAICQLNIL